MKSMLPLVWSHLCLPSEGTALDLCTVTLGSQGFGQNILFLNGIPALRGSTQKTELAVASILSLPLQVKKLHFMNELGNVDCCCCC